MLMMKLTHICGAPVILINKKGKRAPATAPNGRHDVQVAFRFDKKSDPVPPGRRLQNFPGTPPPLFRVLGNDRRSQSSSEETKLRL